jgi:molecular chaperone GrpE
MHNMNTHLADEQETLTNQPVEETTAETVVEPVDVSDAEPLEDTPKAAPAPEAPTPTPETNIDWKDRYTRLAADFDNFKKRTNREREEIHRFANEQLLRAILPIFDDFNRTLKATETASDVVAIREGVELVSRRLMSSLEKQGIRRIETQNQPFDSNLHEAIASMPGSEDQKGQILEEVEQGFLYHDKVIRFSKVIIAE